MAKIQAFATDSQAQAVLQAAERCGGMQGAGTSAKDLFFQLHNEEHKTNVLPPKLQQLLTSYPDSQVVEGFAQAVTSTYIDAARKAGKLPDLKEEDVARFKEIFTEQFKDEVKTNVERVQRRFQQMQQHGAAELSDKFASLVPETLRENFTQTGTTTASATPARSGDLATPQVQNIAQKGTDTQLG